MLRLGGRRVGRVLRRSAAGAAVPPPFDASQGFGAGNDVAQTFTVGRTGVLTRVEVLLFSFPGIVDDLVVDVRPTDGNGAPVEGNGSPPVLASVTVAPAAIPTTTAFVAFDLSAFNVAVTAGDVLAIVLRSGSGGSTTYGRQGGADDPYAGGAGFFRNSSATTAWLEMVDTDWGFRTFVEPDLCFGSEPTIAGAGKIQGTPDEDVIVGSVGDDDIDGGGGPDAICGLEGDDDISNGGSTAVDGGPGNDRVKLKGSGGTTLLGGEGDDQLSVKQVSGDNVVSGGTGNDRIKASTKAGSNDVAGGDGADVVAVSTTGGATLVDGGDGDDSIKASSKGGGGVAGRGRPRQSTPAR